MSWAGCKNILCIRPDNMGDLIMTGPAIRALKASFDAKVTVLTSSMAKGIISSMPEIDDAIIYDLPWVKTEHQPDTHQFQEVIEEIKSRNFDAAVIFTVYSQNPLPTAMLAYLAGIPKVLAYCRENPYGLLTNWVPDKEPYQFIKHQVERDLDLVAAVGAFTDDKALSLRVDDSLNETVSQKLRSAGVNLSKRWLILHPGVSEKKRQYPEHLWVEAAKMLIEQKGVQVLFTGSHAEKPLTDQLAQLTGAGSFSLGGLFNLNEFVNLVSLSPILLSVNTGTVHIAAAVRTPVVVLYAQTNPQHTPWMLPNKVLEFAVPEDLQSKNEVIAYVSKQLYKEPVTMPGPAEIIKAIGGLITLPGSPTQPSRGTLHENQATPAS